MGAASGSGGVVRTLREVLILAIAVFFGGWAMLTVGVLSDRWARRAPAPTPAIVAMTPTHWRVTWDFSQAPAVPIDCLDGAAQAPSDLPIAIDCAVGTDRDYVECVDGRALSVGLRSIRLRAGQADARAHRMFLGTAGDDCVAVYFGVATRVP